MYTKKLLGIIGAVAIVVVSFTNSHLSTAYASDWKQDGRGYTYEDYGGNRHTGWLQQGGQWFYFDSAGYMVADKVVTSNGMTYYLDSNGVMVTGWQYINGAWYYFSYKGEMQTGWHYVGDYWYYLLTDSGRMATGWNFINGRWYFMYDSGNMASDKWVDCNGSRYYVFKDGSMATGIQNISGTKYIFKSTGEWIPDADEGQNNSGLTVEEEVLYNMVMPESTWDEVKVLGDKFYNSFYETVPRAIEKLNAVRRSNHQSDLLMSTKLTKSAFALCITNKAWDYWGYDMADTNTKEFEACLDLYDAKPLAITVTMAKGKTLDEALNQVLSTQTGISVIQNVNAETCGVGFIKMDNEYRVAVYVGKTAE